MVLFAAIPARRAMLVSILVAWMFLPAVSIPLPGIPNYTKAMAACVSALCGALLFDPRRLMSFRPSILDVPAVAWCLCPFASSMANELGPYDGMSEAITQTVQWGIPYFLGRVYLTSHDGFREFAVLLFYGGLAYVPFCLWEIRMSPNLNQMLYGFGGTGVAYAAELGSWGSRSKVFMGDGLTLGMFMTAASLCGVWLWRTRSLVRIAGYRAGYLVALVVLTAFACKNMGALVLLVAGLVLLSLTARLRTKAFLFVLLLMPATYMVTRTTGAWSGDVLVDAAGAVHARRAESLGFRLKNEELLIHRALVRPTFGWGGWGRAGVYDEDTGRSLTIADGLWVITLGTNGVFGLCSFVVFMLLPPLLNWRRIPMTQWKRPEQSAVIVSALIVGLYMVDCLVNAMLNPVYVVAVGGLVSMAYVRQPRPTRVAPARVGI